MHVVIVLALAMVITGCRTTGTRWVQEEVISCPGGRIDTQRRITDTLPGGRTRSTLIRTNACLE